MELFYTPSTIQSIFSYVAYASSYRTNRLELSWYALKEERFIDLHFHLKSSGFYSNETTFSYTLDNELGLIFDLDHSDSLHMDLDLPLASSGGKLTLQQLADLKSYALTGSIKQDIASSLIFFYHIARGGGIAGLDVQLESSREFSRLVSSLEKDYESELIKSIRDEESRSRARERVILELQLFTSEYDDRMHLSARVGNEKKLYVVKDIDRFISGLGSQVEVRYGKAFSWDGNTDDLDEMSSFYLDLMRSELLYDGYYSKAKDAVLSKKGLAELFSFLADRNLTLFLNGRMYNLRKKNPNITFRIRRDSSKAFLLATEISNSISSYTMSENSGHAYFVSEDERMIYIPDEEYELWAISLAALLRAEGPIVIAVRDIPSFMSVVLPRMRVFGTVRGLELIPQEYLPEEPEFSFRLSLQEDDSVLNSFIYIQCMAKYESGTYSLFRADRSNGNQLSETRMMRILENSILKDAIHQEDGFDIMLSDDDYLIDVMQRICPALSTYGTLELDHNLINLKRVDRPIIDVGVKLESNLLELNFNYDARFLKEVPKILEAVRKKRRYYRLKSGEFLSLEEGSLKELSTLAEELDINEKELVAGRAQVPLFRALYLDQSMKGYEELSYRRNETFRALVRAVKSYEDSSREIPSDVRAELRSYQKSGFRWLGTLADENLAGILADDMGLGKTLQILTLMDDYLASNGMLKAVVVAPASLLINWREEARRFTPSLKVLPLLGNAQDRRALLERDANVYVTSYAALLRDVEIMNEEYDFVILDEAQAIKNAATKQAQSVKNLRARHRFALTGTPIENNLSELWSIFDFLLPGLLFGRTEFRRRFENPIMKGDGKSLALLKRIVSPFIMRRMKSEVLKELPEKSIITRKIDLEEEQAKLYKALFLTSKREYRKLLHDKGLEKSRIEILALLTKLRMACCDPSLVVDDFQGASSKLESLMELIQECTAGDHRILLFSQFTSMLDIIQRRIVEEGLSFYRIDGSTPKEARMEYVEAFQKDSTPILLLSLKAGGLGLNLTAADTVIIYDPWWNLTSEEQAIDRAYRIGQMKNIQVYRLIASETIEEKIQELQEKKAQLALSLLDRGENEGQFELSEADWESLFT